MAKKKKTKPKIDPKLQVWIDAKKRHRLSQAHIQMARELGMNPKKFGKIDNHRQQPWKAPLPGFIERLYEKRFGRSRLERVLLFKALAKEQARKREARKQAKAKRQAERAGGDNIAATGNRPAHSVSTLTPQGEESGDYPPARVADS